jgi:hypothetical protein
MDEILFHHSSRQGYPWEIPDHYFVLPEGIRLKISNEDENDS